MSLGDLVFVLSIAGLQGVDKQYYEAAAIDGIKNRWQELWFVTLPLMKPQLMFRRGDEHNQCLFLRRDV